MKANQDSICTGLFFFIEGVGTTDSHQNKISSIVA